MAKKETLEEQNKFDPSALISLYEIDARSLNGPLLRFHAGVNGKYESIIFDGIEYTAFPMEISDVETDGKGTLPRIKVTGSNVKGILSAFLINTNNLIGARFIRRRVFARFLDSANFPNGKNPFGTPDPTAAYADEIFYVNRKIQETAEVVQFECVTPLELDNVKLPNRLVFANLCPFKYRDSLTCGYSGPPITDRFSKSFTGVYGFTLSNEGVWLNTGVYNQGQYVYRTSEIDQTYGQTFVFVCSRNGASGIDNDPLFDSSSWVMDACPHNLLGCKTHYPTGALQYGGFAGASRSKFV